GLGRHGFLHCRIEGFADWVDDLESRIAERLEQLFLHHVDTLNDRRGVSSGGIDVRESRDVVESIDELADEVRLGARAGIAPLTRRALAVVVVFGGEAQVPLTLRVALLLRGRIPAALALAGCRSGVLSIGRGERWR